MRYFSKNIKDLKKKFLDGIGSPEPKEFKPDAFQLNAIKALEEGKDTLVVAPTGAGKTYIAVKAIERVISSKKRAIYTAPLKALSNSKYTEFRQMFSPEYGVGLLTGDRKVDGDAEVVVATTEIYRNELYRYSQNYKLVVLDELHYLADPQRGPVWEESIILSALCSNLLMLSASISNPEEVAEWIQSIRNKPVEIIEVTKRPVELRLGFCHPDLGVLPLGNQKGEPLKEVSNYYSSYKGFNKKNRYYRGKKSYKNNRPRNRRKGR